MKILIMLLIPFIASAQVIKRAPLYTPPAVTAPPSTTTVYDTIDANTRDAYTYGSLDETLNYLWDAEQQIFLGNPDGNLERTGFQFQLNIAQGKTIDSAFVIFHSGASIFGTPTTDSVYFRVFDLDNAPVFVEAHAHDMATHGTTSATQIGWAPSSWTTSTTYTSPNLKALVQIPISRAGWVANNYICIWFDPAISCCWASGDEVGISDFQSGTTANFARIRVVYQN